MEAFKVNHLHYHGHDKQTFTFHCLTKHLIEDTKKHGSLKGHSLFSLESCLGTFNKTLNGTTNLPFEYIRSKS